MSNPPAQPHVQFRTALSEDEAMTETHEHTREEGVALPARRSGKNLRVVEWFNAACPIGSHVLYWPGAREGEPRRGVTRSEAWLLGGHTPVVMVEGYAGGIALSHVMGYDPATTVAPPADPEATG